MSILYLYINYNFRKFLRIEFKDPLTIVNCARILMTLPETVQDLTLGKELLTIGLLMAPNDLIVLKHIAQVIIIVCKKNVTTYNTPKLLILF